LAKKSGASRGVEDQSKSGKKSSFLHVLARRGEDAQKRWEKRFEESPQAKSRTGGKNSSANRKSAFSDQGETVDEAGGKTTLRKIVAAVP